MMGPRVLRMRVRHGIHPAQGTRAKAASADLNMKDRRSPSDPPSPAPTAADDSAEAREQAPRPPSGILASLLESTPYRARPAPLGEEGCLVGVCTDDRHPALVGRVRVRHQTGDEEREQWVPVLRGVAVRVGDQLLLNQPRNGGELIVVGVVDAFARRDAVPQQAAARLELKPDEVLRVEDARGRTLLELRADETGPVVRLLQQGLAIEVDGKLSFRADAIQLQARQGAVEINASDEVCVKGKVIHLN
jgi:hypothetical protein